MLKPLVKSTKALIKNLLHSLLVPVITILKCVEAGIKHLIKELSKV